MRPASEHGRLNVSESMEDPRTQTNGAGVPVTELRSPDDVIVSGSSNSTSGDAAQAYFVLHW